MRAREEIEANLNQIVEKTNPPNDRDALFALGGFALLIEVALDIRDLLAERKPE
jgi:hypothetical protein